MEWMFPSNMVQTIRAGVDEGAPGVAAHDVVVGREIERRLRIELAPRGQPAVGNAERLLAGGALEEPCEGRERLDRAGALLPAFHPADVQAQGEGRIRPQAPAINRKTCARAL